MQLLFSGLPRVSYGAHICMLYADEDTDRMVALVTLPCGFFRPNIFFLLDGGTCV